MVSDCKAELVERAKEELRDKSITISPLIGGNSLSENYILKTSEGKTYIAKLNDKRSIVSRHKLISQLYVHGAAIAQPITEFDMEDRIHRCTISIWVPGRTLDTCLDGNFENTFRLAKAVCKALYSIHTYDSKQFPQITLTEEINLYLSFFNEHQVVFPHKERYIELIENRGWLSKERHSCVHMDVHTKNIVVNSMDGVTLIDCENAMLSDPWRDFVYSVAFHNGVEQLFWISVIMEYFQYAIPKDFWETTRFYSIIHLFRMIICNYRKKNYASAERISESLFTTYNRMESCIPGWTKKYLMASEEIVGRLSIL